MKKFICALGIILILGTTGCTSGPVDLDIDAQLPWRIYTTLTNPSKESMTFKLQRFAGDVKSPVVTTDDSYLKYTLTEGKKTVVGHSGKTEELFVATVKMEMSISYVPNLNLPDSGKTDRITSEVQFELNTLDTIYSHRRAVIADRDGQDNPSYEITTDYLARTSEITYADGNVEKLSVKKAPVPNYDNEMLFYLVRSLSTITPNGTASFELSSMYDSFLTKKYASLPVKQTTDTGTTDVEIDENIYNKLLDTEDRYTKTLDDATLYYAVCYKTAIQLNQTKSGPGMQLFFSKGFFSSDDKITKKIPIAIVNYEYNGKAQVTGTQVCTLTDYEAGGYYGV